MSRPIEPSRRSETRLMPGRATPSDGTHTRPAGVVLALALGLGLAVPAGAQQALQWEREYDHSGGSDWFESKELALQGTRIIAGGTIHAGTADQRFLIRAHDVRDGSLAWHYESATVGRAWQMTSGAGRVFQAGTGPSGGVDVTVRAVRASDGALAWETSVGDPVNGDTPANIACSDGRTFVLGLMYLGTGRFPWVAALDAATGALLWRVDLFSGVTEGLAVSDGVVYTAGSGVIRALDAGDGHELWNRTGAGLMGDVIVRGETLYTSGPGTPGTAKVAAYDRWDGTLLWNRFLPIRPYVGLIKPLEADDERVYVATDGVGDFGDADLDVTALAGSDGTIVWTTSLDVAGGNDGPGAGVALHGRTLVVPGRGRNAAGNQDCLVLGLDALDGSILFQDVYDRAGRDESCRTVAVRGPLVFAAGSSTSPAGDMDATLRAYRLPEGAGD